MRSCILSFCIILLWALILPVVGQDIQSNKDEVRRIGNVMDYVRINGYKHKTAMVNPDLVHLFPGVTGPNHETIIPFRKPTSWKNYAEGKQNRLCIYLSDTTSYWLGIVNGLNSNAIPFRITTDLDEALKHKVVLIYPPITSQNIDLATFNKLKSFPMNGGALIGFALRAPSMGIVFGFKNSELRNDRFSIRFDPSSSHLVSFVTVTTEKVISIGNLEYDSSAFYSYSFNSPEYQPLATYNDGSPAMVQKLYTNGLALAIGIDLGYFTMVGHFNYDAEYQRSHSNDFEPTLDVFYQVIKRVYLNYAKHPVILGSVPDNRHVPVVISYDVDTKDAVPNALLYAEVMRRAGVSGTFNIQTKYIKDGQDEAFFNSENLKYLSALKAMGMEIGSHSVSHTPFLNYIPMGTGREKYPEYRPIYVTTFSTFNETLLGEARVSKFLLDHLLNNETVSWRSGYLGYSSALHIALDAVGIRYSSSSLANELLTHMPFQAIYDNRFNQVIDVYEFPVTIEDEELPPMYERLGQASFVTEQVSKYGGAVIVLIHPNELGQKIDFLRDYIDLYKSKAWFGTMGEYGTWFRSRIHTRLDVEEENGILKIQLFCPYVIHGLPVKLPDGYGLVSSFPADLPFRQEPGWIILNRLSGGAILNLQRF